MQVVIYHSRHGFTKEVSKIIASRFDHCMIMDVEEIDDQILRVAKQIIIGTPVYDGQLDEKIVQFIFNYQGLLIEHQYSLFVVGLWQGEFMTPVTRTFHFEILRHMKVIMGVGGLIDFSCLSLKEKMSVEILNKRSPIMKRKAGEMIFCNLMSDELDLFIERVKKLS